MNHPKAFTLVELLVVLTFSSTVLVLSAGTVHQAMRVAETAQHYSQRSFHSNRFFEQFRNDVHLGIHAEAPSSQSLTIELEDHSKIIYAIESNRVTREQAVNDGKIRRDAIALPENAYGTLHFEGASQTASLRVFTNLEIQHAPPRLSRCVDAILARTSMSYSLEEVRP